MFLCIWTSVSLITNKTIVFFLNSWDVEFQLGTKRLGETLKRLDIWLVLVQFWATSSRLLPQNSSPFITLSLSSIFSFTNHIYPDQWSTRNPLRTSKAVYYCSVVCYCYSFVACIFICNWGGEWHTTIYRPKYSKINLQESSRRRLFLCCCLCLWFVIHLYLWSREQVSAVSSYMKSHIDFLSPAIPRSKGPPD